MSSPQPPPGPAPRYGLRQHVGAGAAALLIVEKQAPEQILAAHPELAEHLQYFAHYTYMQQVGNVNTAHEWKDVAARVLVVYGMSDFVTSR